MTSTMNTLQPHGDHGPAAAGPAHGEYSLVFILSAVAGLICYATFDATSLEKGVASKANVYSNT